MKSIDVKSLLIGFLLCATFFLSVGATYGNDNGRYQGFSIGENILNVIDTRTGATWEAEFKDFQGKILPGSEIFA